MIAVALPSSARSRRPGEPVRGRPAAMFVLGVIGIAAPAVGADGPPPHWWGWALLIAGSVAGSVVATGIGEALLRRSPEDGPGRRRRPSGAVVLAIGAAVVAVTVAVGLGLPRVPGAVRALLRDCPAPVEVPVVTAEDDLATNAALARAYERQVAGEGCRPVRLAVYAADPAAVREALLDRWESSEAAEPVAGGPLRDVGPRPRVWLPPSTLEVDRLLAEPPAVWAGPVPFGGGTVYARTPLVLAAPGGRPVAATTWSGAVEALARQGLDLVRTDPAVSPAGEFAVAALLGLPPSGERSQADTDAGRREEQATAAALRRSGYPLGGAGSVLRAYAARSCAEPQRVAFLLPEQLAEQPELVGARVGEDCPERTGLELRRVWSAQPLQLDRPAVVLDWGGDGPALAQARRFRDWLVSEPGQDAVRRLGLAAAAAGVTPGLSAAGSGPLNPELLGTVEDALRFRETVRRPVRVLVAVDTSLSMAAHWPAARAVTADLVARLGEADQVGLLTFGRNGAELRIGPGEAGPAGDPRRLRAQVAGVLEETRPLGESPLRPAVAASLEAISVRPASGGELSAVVLVTDGRVPLGAADPGLRAAARRSGPVSIVVVGGRPCGALTAVAEDLRGVCREASGPAGPGLDDVAAGIWGAAGAR